MRELMMKGRFIFTTDQANQLAGQIEMPKGYAVGLLQYLARKGRVIRLRPGQYRLAVDEALNGPLDPRVLAMDLTPLGAVSHWSALHHHGLTEDEPDCVYILALQESHVPKTGTEDAPHAAVYHVAGFTYRFICVPRKRYFGVETVEVDRGRFEVTDRERTLVDGLMRPQHFGGMARVLAGFVAARDRRKLRIRRIAEYGEKMGDTVSRRLGWILRELGYSTRAVRRSRHPQAYPRLDKTRPPSGRHDREWRLDINCEPPWE